MLSFCACGGLKDRGIKRLKKQFLDQVELAVKRLKSLKKLTKPTLFFIVTR